MNQYIIKVHPDLKHEDGLIVVNADSFEDMKEILATVTNHDMNPHLNLGDEPFFNKYQPMNIQEELDLADCPDDCWYVLNVCPTFGKEGFVAGSYHVG